MRHRLVLALSVLIFSGGVRAEPCTSATKRMKIGEGASLLIRNEECPNSDRLVVKVLLQRKSESPQVLVRKTNEISDWTFKGGEFIDLENDGIPEVELTGHCSATNCAYGIYKLSEDQKSMYHYYDGGYSSVTRTPNYLVTSLYLSYGSWEYLAYDPSPPKYPIENSKFRYSVYISSAADSNKLTCKITEPTSRGKRQLVVPPPEELLRFCRHYGEDVPVRITNLHKPSSSRGH